VPRDVLASSELQFVCLYGSVSILKIIPTNRTPFTFCGIVSTDAHGVDFTIVLTVAASTSYHEYAHRFCFTRHLFHTI